MSLKEYEKHNNKPGLDSIMGYTHYYLVSKEFDAKLFSKVAVDFKKMVLPLQHLGVKLADGLGENTPKITPTEICFNGLEKCGHTERELGITWPSDKAEGVSNGKVGTILAEIVKGSWFGGAQLETRACGGDCSHETFSLVQKLETTITRGDGSTYEIEPQGKTNHDGSKKSLKEVGKYFQFTKTAYKPYDLAVTVALVIAKHYLKSGIVISSDGEIGNWQEGMQLCQHFLGYGEKFKLGR